MEIGNEISQKIRSAIKTKLVELGAYEDEELPDYIMVMVANKKTREQMNEDLHLFLGNSTEKFTAWLLSILNKLKAITIGNPPSVAAVIPQEVNTTKNPRSNSNGTDNKEHELIPELLLQTETDEFNEEQEEINTLNATEKSDITKTLTTTCDKINKVNSDLKTAPSISTTTTKITSRVQPSMFYLNSASNNITSQTQSSISNENTISSQSAAYVFPKSKPITSRLQMDLISNSHKSQIPKVITHPIISKEQQQLQLARQNRKRRIPGSVIGSIIHHSSEEEEEYDPYNPSYGSVASVIRVTERKSSIPPELQANKCLLLKAVKDAHKSLATQEKRNAEHAMIKPMFHEVPEKKLKMSERMKSKQPPLFTRSKLAEQDFPESNQYNFGEEEDDELDGRQNKLRQVECNKPGQRIAVIKHLESAKLNEELNNESIAEIELDEDIQLCSNLLNLPEEDLVETPLPARIVKKNKKETEDKTQFIVTLDGYDAPKMNSTSSFQSPTDQNETTNSSMQYQMTQIKPLAFNISDTTDEDEELDETKSSALKTTTEKCKFWPSCQNGTHCKYYHPSSPCSKFPKCKFGQNCLYIHPKCKFDTKCSRTDCPFSHSYAKPAAPPVAVQSLPAVPVAPPATRQPPTQTLQCKFFPTCKNMNCPFTHPKPCRYGISCTNKTFCTFYHPPLPSKNQLRWKAEKSRAENQSELEDDMELNVVHWNNPYKVVNTSS
ncbi:zinc finger CCCH domain-containing protein 14 isoform X2 [Octopus bimaculoides]|uniref:Zinc finger CCCH domain-containing protein 14 n=1 Tax=Octopus bimaculoides TaxID=37653 RepID=A0A0L8GRZ8_OCTBM|nr:zinc finger CCCH domain-containing protein 14 isoform X2 [Octopus bimaculoides]|eukprot:XP_014778633.1 PREDICTED: zinc finger CCCH domain-containing protein 14-like isoform X3 [Octopus bimaculoides]